MKKRIVQTTILFLAFILIGLFVRAFVSDSELFVTSDSDTQQAQTNELNQTCHANSLC